MKYKCNCITNTKVRETTRVQDYYVVAQTYAPYVGSKNEKLETWQVIEWKNEIFDVLKIFFKQKIDFLGIFYELRIFKI